VQQHRRPPKPHEVKYTIQILEVNSNTPSDQKLMSNSNQVEEILKNSDTKIYEYPTLYAEVGETVADDQTRLVSMPEDYDVIDRKAVEVSISSIKKNSVTYKIDIHNQKLVGYAKIKLAQGIEVKMPYIRSLNLNS
jgi:hypothetical protein